MVPAIVGQTILEVAQNHKVDIEGPCNGGAAPTQEKRSENWTEYTFGEGPSCFGCHVQIPTKFSHLLEPSSETETVGLAETWEDEKLNTSRLACLIKLEKKHDGLVVFIPDAPPMDIM